MIRVAIVADSAILRAGLASVIGSEPDVRIVATSASGDRITDANDVPTSSRDHAPMEEADVLVVVPSQAMSITDVLPTDESDLDDLFRGPATMVLIERMDASVAQDAFAAGVSAVLAIDSSAEELRAALRAVAAGLVVFPARVSTELLATTRVTSTDAGSKSSSAPSLTSREREVLALLAQGFANKVIASRLGITEHTVKTHVAAVYEKLHARNRAEVLVAAARQGLVIL